jgi:hypothetical protein
MQAASCLMRWYANETVRAYARLGYSGTILYNEFERQIRTLLLKFGGTATKRELERADSSLAKNWEKFDALIERGFVTIEETKRTKKYKWSEWAV